MGEKDWGRTVGAVGGCYRIMALVLLSLLRCVWYMVGREVITFRVWNCSLRISEFYNFMISGIG